LIGTKLAHFELTAKLGEGGMGEVYRAMDGKLGREVAIKVLPEAFVADPERLARFEREARLLASLSHPSIAGIHEAGEAEGIHYLVMELVPGATLADLLARGPIPLDEAIPIALQIAEALEAAHERGIVHRDLKPANVKVDELGRVKVLDFGLAKALELERPEASDSALAASPTLTYRDTEAGFLIGTAAYMSPEQARGRPTDRRADIWAFGVVLWEMLTGRSLFAGDTISDTLAGVLREEVDWSRLPADTPAAVRRVLRRCLERDPKRRLRDIGDARLELLEPMPVEERGPGSGRPEPAARRPLGRIAVFLAGAALTALAFWLLGRGETPGVTPLTRFALHDLGMQIDAFQGVALSPDGRRLVFRREVDGGPGQLEVRSLDAFVGELLPGTENGRLPFFSPDGERIGFYATGELRTIALGSGVKRTVADVLGVGGFSGGAWLPDDTIVFAPVSGRTFARVPATGGEVERLEIRDAPEISIVTSPWALPDGQAVLCSAGDGSRFDIAVFDLATRTLKIVATNGFTPVYVRTGHVLYQQGAEGPLMALPFDAERRVATGPAFPVVADLGSRVSYQGRMFAVADDGTLAYIPQTSLLAHGALIWVDQEGQTDPIVEVPRVIDIPRLSPDGRRIAFRAPAPQCDIWLHDLERGTTTRVTREGDNHGLAWMPDGERIAFARRAGDGWSVWATRTDGVGEVEKLAPTEMEPIFVASASPDSRYVLVETTRETTAQDVDLFDLEDGSVRPIFQSRYDERSPAFSPDGRHLAYVSNETGRFEVYVRPFPGLDSREQISTAGGMDPVWAPDGRALYFRWGRELMAVDLLTEPSLRAGRPRPLFEFDSPSNPHGLPSFDVSADGERFVMLRERSAESGAELHVVLGWFGELERSQLAER
jgi:serine/threonine-protein kinase